MMKRTLCLLALTSALSLSAQAPTKDQTDLPPKNAAAPDPIEALRAQAQSYRGKDHITAPVLTHQTDPKIPREARKQALKGAVLVNLIVDDHGMPRGLRVLKPLGYGLDESALDAVRKYRFKPATLDGSPIPIELNVEVNFVIFDK